MEKKKIVISAVLVVVLVTGTVCMILNGREPAGEKQGGSLSGEYEEPTQSVEASESAEETTENTPGQGSILGTWRYQGKDYTEYVSFGTTGDYGYTAVPVEGNEQCFSGRYEAVGEKVRIYANDEEEELSFSVDGDRLMLGDKTYVRHLLESSEEEK